MSGQSPTGWKTLGENTFSTHKLRWRRSTCMEATRKISAGWTTPLEQEPSRRRGSSHVYQRDAIGHAPLAQDREHRCCVGHIKTARYTHFKASTPQPPPNFKHFKLEAPPDSAPPPVPMYDQKHRCVFPHICTFHPLVM